MIQMLTSLMKSLIMSTTQAQMRKFNFNKKKSSEFSDQIDNWISNPSYPIGSEIKTFAITALYTIHSILSLIKDVMHRYPSHRIYV